MIKKSEAIAIGTAIVEAMKTECRNMDVLDGLLRDAAHGTAWRAMDTIWHKVFTPKVRAQFDYEEREFFKESGWKD
jgi:hypothetical protein